MTAHERRPSSAVALGIPVPGGRPGTGPGRTPTFTPDRPRPDSRELIDSFGRVSRDLRVSLTELCSLRCTYCMPEEGLPAVPAEELMTTEEVVRLVSVGVGELGVREVRLTGGEPLMRADLEEIVGRLRTAWPSLPIALTSNAVGLEHRAQKLARAGLTRINISLDTVDRELFAAVTRRDRLPSVLAGIRAARDAGLRPLKINAVPLRKTVAGAPELLAWALDEGVRLRFIEQMPLDADHAWDRADMVTGQELLTTLQSRFDLTPAGRDDPADPAELWTVEGHTQPGGAPATVGLIATVTRNFCAACDRTRLTAEGSIRPCLFGDDEVDLLGPLREGASDDRIAELWRTAVWHKWAGHDIDSAAFTPPARSMGAIGG